MFLEQLVGKHLKPAEAFFGFPGQHPALWCGVDGSSWPTDHPMQGSGFTCLRRLMAQLGIWVAI